MPLTINCSSEVQVTSPLTNVSPGILNLSNALINESGPASGGALQGFVSASSSVSSLSSTFSSLTGMLGKLASAYSTLDGALNTLSSSGGGGGGSSTTPQINVVAANDAFDEMSEEVQNNLTPISDLTKYRMNFQALLGSSTLSSVNSDLDYLEGINDDPNFGGFQEALQALARIKSILDSISLLSTISGTDSDIQSIASSGFLTGAQIELSAAISDINNLTANTKTHLLAVIQKLILIGALSADLVGHGELTAIEAHLCANLVGSGQIVIAKLTAKDQ